MPILPARHVSQPVSLRRRQLLKVKTSLLVGLTLVVASLITPDVALAERFKCKSAKGRYVFRDAPCGTKSKKPGEKAKAVVRSGKAQRTRGSRSVRNRHLSNRHDRVKRRSQGRSNSTAIGRSASNRFKRDE
ncbi:MAG: hypothetical protein AB8C46_19830 [Burkholderiaceae bacterium]